MRTVWNYAYAIATLRVGSLFTSEKALWRRACVPSRGSCWSLVLSRLMPGFPLEHKNKENKIGQNQPEGATGIKLLITAHKVKLMVSNGVCQNNTGNERRTSWSHWPAGRPVQTPGGATGDPVWTGAGFPWTEPQPAWPLGLLLEQFQQNAWNQNKVRSDTELISLNN